MGNGRIRAGGAFLVFAATSAAAGAGDGNRLAHLDENDPYWPDWRAPKLTTPMWIGPEDADAGVEAAIVLSIDDMMDPTPYEAFLRPILERLKQVEAAAGREPRAPMSIFTCFVDPARPELQTFLREGVSLEVHTSDHPCPLFRGGDLELAVGSVVKSSANLASVPGNEPTAFRMPCCDSLNTSSPRFYDAVLPRTTFTDGNGARLEGPRLWLDSSIAMAFTSDDPDLPRELVQEADGSERFLKYLPRDRRFANYITNYPYPYVVGGDCFELPWIVPSDWEAQHRNGVCSPKSIEDMKAALDLTVLKQGLFTFVFHPWGWMRNDQVIELIDHAVAKHGNKVRFLSVRDVADRLGRSVGFADRHEPILDLDGDGLMEVMAYADELDESGPSPRRIFGETRRWSAATRRWTRIEFPSALKWFDPETNCTSESFPRFGVVHADGRASVILHGESGDRWSGSFDGTRWVSELELLEEIRADDSRAPLGSADDPLYTAILDQWGDDNRHRRIESGMTLRDLDGDGRCELIVSHEHQDAVYRFDALSHGWRPLPWSLPCESQLARIETRPDEDPDDDIYEWITAPRGGVRFLDIDEDGDLDVFASGHSVSHRSGLRLIRQECGVWLFDSIERGFTQTVGVRVGAIVAEASPEIRARFLPLANREDGSDNGLWVKDRALWWVNEDTGALPFHCERRTFNELLAPLVEAGVDDGDSPIAGLPARSPEASLHSLHLRPGFVAELVASEPLVMDPVAIDWGADGRLWVVEMGDYPLGTPDSGTDGTVLGGGRVKFLEDVNGDGRYDRATTFLEGLPYPTGVMEWRDGVLVSAAPHIWFAADRDGDGRAEVREVLLEGFGEGNPQHRVNGFRLGLDGWIHGANGDSDGVIPRRLATLDMVVSVDLSGRDFRFDPDRGFLEPVTGCTQFGRDRDDFGHWFGGNNATPAWHFVLEEAWLARNPWVEPPTPRVEVPQVPGSQPVFPASFTRARFNDLHTANHFTSACSPTVYRDELFGRLSNSLFVCEPVHNLVHREVIERAGVTFTSRRAADESSSEFLASSDPWFRPVSARTGPDGALWVVDMHRDVIEHPEWIPPETQARVDLRAGADRGRIYRVFPVDRGPRPITRLDDLSDDELVDVFEEPNGWRRDKAQQLLIERRAAGVAPRLAAMAMGHERPLARLHALCTLGALSGRGGIHRIPLDVLQHALADPHPELRRWGVRWLERDLEIIRREDTEIADACWRAFIACIEDDPDPGVVMEALAAYGSMDAYASSKATAFIVFRKLVELDADPSFDAQMQKAAAWSSITGERIPRVLELAWIDRDKGGAALLPRLVALHQRDRGSARDGAPLAATADPFAGLPWGRIAEQYPAPDWLAAVLVALVDSTEAGDPGRTQARDLLVEYLGGDRERARALFERTAASAYDRSRPVEERLLAIRLFGAGPFELADAIDGLESLLMPGEPSEVSAAAARRMGDFDVEWAPLTLIERWRWASPSLRVVYLEQLLRRVRNRAELLEAVQSGRIDAWEIDLATRTRLLQDEHPDIRAAAAAAFGGPPNPDRAAVIEAFQPALTLAGDRARGQLVFENRCASCHALRGLGHAVGPDLASMADQSPESWLIAILDPNRAVESRYVAYHAVTRGGDILTGVLAEETATSIKLRDSGGKEQVVLRADLESLRSSSKSLMTEGLEGELVPQDLADLFAFLRADARPGKRFDGNEPILVRSMGECGMLVLSAANAEIHGPSLVFEPRYGNLGYWHSTDDLAAWTVEVPRAASYEVALDFACAPESAGDVLVLEVAGRQLTFEVPSTGTWDAYQETTLGTVDLDPGLRRVTVRAAAPPQRALVDLRTLRFTPKL